MIKIIEKSIDELIPYENNVRINDNAVDVVANSIKEFGFKNPVIIDKDGVIVAGHTRVEACKKLGIDKVPCIIADDLTEEQIKAFRIADNSSAQVAEWDMQKLMAELETIDYDMSKYGLAEQIKELQNKVESELKTSEDNFDAETEYNQIEAPKAKLGDVYKLGNHRLMCGDSTNQQDVDKLMQDELADVVFTDPPYGVSYKGTNNPNGKEWEIIKNDTLRGDELFLFLLEAFKNIKRKLKWGGSFYIWYANSNSIQFETALEGALLKKKQILIWQKGMVLGHSDYHWSYEPCLYGCHPEKNCEWYGDRCQTTYWNLDKKDLDKLKKEEAIELLKKIYNDCDVWEIKRDNVMEYVHPTQKPTGLAGKALKNSTTQEMIVLDLFGGSGSTLIACEQLNRKARLMEIDPKYVDVIISRWEKLTGKKAQKIC